MFKSVPDRLNLNLIEEDILAFWQTQRVYEKCRALHQEGHAFIVTSYPPIAHGKPGMQEALACIHQDLWVRYKSMQGFEVMRRGGWNAHGLPVERLAESLLGAGTKAQIEGRGIGNFNDYCYQLARESIQARERLNERLGCWQAMDESPVSSDNSAIEIVWGVLKQAWDRGLLTQDERITPYCPRCGTQLADDEARLVSAVVDSPSAYVRMPLQEDPGTALLVWTDQPWSLPGNVAVAVKPEIDYVIVERDLSEDEAGKGSKPEKLILAREMLDTVCGQESVRVYESFRGSKLKGVKYRPLFQFLLPDKPAYRVVMADFILGETGSGLIQLSPAFDTNHLKLAQQHDLPVLTPLNPDGTFSSEVRPWRGMFFKDAESYILQDLQERGLLYRAEVYRQTASFCWSCGTQLLPFVRNGWYLRNPNDGTEWRIGRERYWGTPLPIWQCTHCAHQLAIASLQILCELTGRNLSGMDLHRPEVDEVTLACPQCEGIMRRLPLVLDAVLDAGTLSLPADQTETALPADLVCEVRGRADRWVSAICTLSSLFFGGAPYQHEICLPFLAEAETDTDSPDQLAYGDPWDVIHDHGVETIRWAFLTIPAMEERFYLTNELLMEARNTFFLPLWDIYRFLVNSALQAGWSPHQVRTPAAAGESVLDRWLVSRLNLTIKAVTTALEAYDTSSAAGHIQALVNDMRDWYVPLSKRGLMPQAEKAAAQATLVTLYQAFLTLNRMLAPFLPFITEEFHQKLVRTFDYSQPTSVHLTDWPVADERLIDAQLNHQLALVQKLVELGQSAREREQVSRQQPLARASVILGSEQDVKAMQTLTELLMEALSVKHVEFQVDEALTAPGEMRLRLDFQRTIELVLEGLAEEFSRRILEFRQKAGLAPNASIRLFVTATPLLARAIGAWQAQIMGETLCTELNLVSQPSSQTPGAVASGEQGRVPRRLYTMLEFEGERVTFGIEKVVDQ